MTAENISELLERAAASVTPTELEPGATMLRRGRRRVRVRRAWGAGVVAAVVAAVVAVPVVMSLPDRDAAPPATTTVEYGGLTIVVGEDWRTVRSETFDSCNAEEHTVYLAGRWNSDTRPPSGVCPSSGKQWLAVTLQGIGRLVSPDLLMAKDGQMLQVEQPDPYILPSMQTYLALDNWDTNPAVFVSGDEAGRQAVLKRVTWPAGPPAPPSGGLALPERPTDIVTDGPPPTNAMAVVEDARTVAQVRATLAELNDPVPADEVCELRKPGAVGFTLSGEGDDDVLVVLGDASCPQAISSGGGHVRVPPGLGKDLYDLIVEKSI